MSAASLPNFTGCIIDDRYELLQMLGSGTFGVVYKAIDLEVADNFDNIVAVKIVRKAGRSDAELAIIKREVAMHSVVADIEGVVTLIDAFDDAKWCYIVLEFCQGGDLFEQIITKQSYLGNDELLRRAFLSLVDAVQACHDAGIAHRDLKPENVLISQDGSRCYLADFGLATNQPVVRDFGIGTGLYMSPECVGELTARQAYDPYLSDIWALGVILVNMITAQNPWARATPKDANFCQFVTDPDFLFNTSPMSEGAHAIIQSLLDLHPAGRMCLRSLRQAILSLDTFFRLPPQFGYVVLEHQRTAIIRIATATSSSCATESDSEYQYEYKSPYMASEIDIPCVAPVPHLRVARDFSAGPAVDSCSTSTTTTSSSYSSSDATSSCSSSRTSSRASDAESVFTLEGTTATTAHMMWDGMTVGGHLHQKEVRGVQKNGATAQMITTQHQYQQVVYVPLGYLIY